METTVHGYRTEILIPHDRVLVLHLPEGLPTGRAILVVEPLETGAALVPRSFKANDDDDLAQVLDFERGDMEWWDEFEEHSV